MVEGGVAWAWVSAGSTEGGGVWTHLNGGAGSQFVNIRPSFIISGDSTASVGRAPLTST